MTSAGVTSPAASVTSPVPTEEADFVLIQRLEAGLGLWLVSPSLISISLSRACERVCVKSRCRVRDVEARVILLPCLLNGAEAESGDRAAVWKSTDPHSPLHSPSLPTSLLPGSILDIVKHRDRAGDR